MKNFVFISPHFPSSYWRFCLALKNRGFRVLGIGDAPYNELSEECRFALDEYYCCTDMGDYENEKRAVKYFEDKYGKIDYLESNNEYWLEKDAHLRSDFNITSGPTLKDIEKYKLKSVQKQYYEKAGLKCARYILVDTLDNVKKFVKEVNYPVFVKPDNGVGAQDSHKIKDDLELEVWFKNKDSKKTYIMEEYVNGQIISFDGITNSKAEIIFATSNVFENDNSEIVEKELDDMYYCVPKVDDALLEMGKKAIASFEVRNRFFHLEWFVLKEDHPYLGKKGTIVPLEANMRPAGAYTPDLINYANSTNCYEIFADSIAYDENREDMTYTKFFACACSRRNKYKYVRSLDEVLSKYHNNVTFYGSYPAVLRDDMGDTFVMAKFLTLEEIREFDKFVREKIAQ